MISDKLDVHQKISLQESGPKKLSLVFGIVDYQTVNIVFTIRNQGFMDLESIAKRTRIKRYDPTTFPGLSIRLPKTKVTMTFFKSGTINSAGASSVSQMEEALEEIWEQFEKDGLPNYFTKIGTIENIVIVITIKNLIDIEGFYEGYTKEVEYEQERFPGLILIRYILKTLGNDKKEVYLEDREVTSDVSSRYKKVTGLLFHSGKLVVTGFKDPERIPSFLEYIYDEIKKQKSILK